MNSSASLSSSSTYKICNGLESLLATMFLSQTPASRGGLQGRRNFCLRDNGNLDVKSSRRLVAEVQSLSGITVFQASRWLRYTSRTSAKGLELCALIRTFSSS